MSCDTLYVTNIQTHESARRKGWAKQVLRAVLDHTGHNFLEGHCVSLASQKLFGGVGLPEQQRVEPTVWTQQVVSARSLVRASKDLFISKERVVDDFGR